MTKIEPLYQAEKVVNILNAITKVKQGMRELDENLKGINSTTYKTLRAFPEWNDLEDWDNNSISFKKEVL